MNRPSPKTNSRQAHAEAHGPTCECRAFEVDEVIAETNSQPDEQGQVESGVDLIAAERKRQVLEEGWRLRHDDSHDKHELALAAACYAAPDRIYIGRMSEFGATLNEPWPWESAADKRDRDVRCWYPGPLGEVLKTRPGVRQKRIRELFKAGALIAAEIDRLQRIGS